MTDPDHPDASAESGRPPAPLDLTAPITRRELLRAAALGGGVLLLPGLSGCIDDPPLQPAKQRFGGESALFMSGEPFLGEIRLMSFELAPRGWALCNGQLLPINQNQALFALLGTTYGGNGMTTFALPDLRGRVAMHRGGGHVVGERAGAASHTLGIAELPTHTHRLRAAGANANAPVPAGNALAAANNLYSPTLDRVFDPETGDEIPLDAVPAPVAFFSAPGTLTPLAPSTVASAGGSQPHENRQPYLGLSYCIALQGIFPSAN